MIGWIVALILAAVVVYKYTRPETLPDETDLAKYFSHEPNIVAKIEQVLSKQKLTYEKLLAVNTNKVLNFVKNNNSHKIANEMDNLHKELEELRETFSSSLSKCQNIIAQNHDVLTTNKSLEKNVQNVLLAYDEIKTNIQTITIEIDAIKNKFDKSTTGDNELIKNYNERLVSIETQLGNIEIFIESLADAHNDKINTSTPQYENESHSDHESITSETSINQNTLSEKL